MSAFQRPARHSAGRQQGRLAAVTDATPPGASDGSPHAIWRPTRPVSAGRGCQSGDSSMMVVAVKCCWFVPSAFIVQMSPGSWGCPRG